MPIPIDQWFYWFKIRFGMSIDKRKKTGFLGKIISIRTEEKAHTFSRRSDCSKGGINRIEPEK